MNLIAGEIVSGNHIEDQKMKILVTGVGGQLGYDVCKVLDARKIETGAVDWRI